MRVLLVEDEPQLASALERGLRREGIAVDTATDGATALEKTTLVEYDVVVLDRALPIVHGDVVCATLRERETPSRILMLTASGTTQDLVDGLALGADDYLGKPFAFEELVARIRALARRAPATSRVLERAGVRLDLGSRAVTRDGDEIKLTPKELAVLEELLARRRQRRQRRGAARTGVGRVHRSLHEHRSGHGDDAATQARRPSRDRNRHRRRLPDPVNARRSPSASTRHVRRSHLSARWRLTLWYTALFFVAGAVLLSLNYFLVDHSLTQNPDEIRIAVADKLGISPNQVRTSEQGEIADSDDRSVFRDVQSQIAHEHLEHLLTESAIALGAMTIASLGLGWLIAGRVLRPCIA